MTTDILDTDEAVPQTPPDADPKTRPTVKLLPGRHKRARAGHPWVFSNEIDMTAAAKALPAGAPVTLTESGGGPLGVATFNPHPLISARFLSRDVSARIDAGWLARRLQRALDLRDRLFDEPFYRVVHAEADGLPGLIVDRYGDVCVVQLNTAGMDRLAPPLLEALHEVLAPATVILRNDSPARALEGLAEDVRVEGAPLGEALGGPLELTENGVRFLADPAGGQKTGWFYDHRENRARVARLSSGLRVLDVYCYLGGFGIQAAAAGAAEVQCVDSSQPALDLAQRSAELNGLGDNCRFTKAEAFGEMGRLGAAGEKFDVVIADPPAFVKSKKDLKTGAKGYRKMVRLAASVVAPDGWLLAASCSHNVDLAMFQEALRGGLRDARRGGRIVHVDGAGPDHPVHPYLPESAYLKAVLLRLD